MSASARAQSRQGLFSRRDQAVIAAAAISMLLVQMDLLALSLMPPVIARDVAAPTPDLQWLVSGYMLALGALMITGGPAADLRGRRRVLVAGLTGFGAVSVLRVATLLSVLGAAALAVLVRRVRV
ncbi:MFS transporter [Streptomyces sp. NPDC058701]|uniref:MFS transporter n=1 Tax=Streptomyces sp. NPDC058701 TaxID=3346608 RepID=UPI0036484C55